MNKTIPHSQLLAHSWIRKRAACLGSLTCWKYCSCSKKKKQPRKLCCFQSRELFCFCCHAALLWQFLFWASGAIIQPLACHVWVSDLRAIPDLPGTFQQILEGERAGKGTRTILEAFFSSPFHALAPPRGIEVLESSAETGDCCSGTWHPLLSLSASILKASVGRDA